MRVGPLLTGEELLQMSQHKRYELVRGELVKMPPPPGGPHGVVTVNAAFVLKAYSRQTGRGLVVVESGVYTERDPDSVRGPDVAYYDRERLPERRAPEGYFTVPPELAVEVVSPRDRWTSIEERVLEFLRAGVKRVWVVDPGTRTVHVYGPGLASRILSDQEDLSGEDALPGFACPVGDLFDL